MFTRSRVKKEGTMEANRSRNKQRMRANERVEKGGELTEKTVHLFSLLSLLLLTVSAEAFGEGG